MSQTPIGDAVQAEYGVDENVAPAEDVVRLDSPYSIPGDAVVAQDTGDAEPPAEVDPAPVLNDDADDDLADVPDGVDDGDTDLEDED